MVYGSALCLCVFVFVCVICHVLECMVCELLCGVVWLMMCVLCLVVCVPVRPKVGEWVVFVCAMM